VVCIFADSAVHRVVIRCELLTSDASLAGAGEISTSANLNEDKVPPSIKNVFDAGRDIDNVLGGNDFVVALHVSIVELVEPKAVLFLTEDVQVVDAAHVLNVALSSQRGERTCVRVHRGKDDSRILNSSSNVFWPIEPVDANGIDWLTRVIVGMEKFHDSGKVIGLAGRLADEVGMVWYRLAVE
jgi:hypothetical protein